MEHSGFNTFDYIALGLIILSGIHAFRRGFVKEIFALGTWIGAAVVAASYYPALRPWIMSHNIKNELAADALSAIALFGITLLCLIPTGNLLAGFIKGPTLSAIDRSMGFVFGLMKGLLILCLVYLALGFVYPEADEQPKWMAEARVAPLLADGADMLKNFVPQDERDEAAAKLEEKREEADKAMEDAEHLDAISTPVPGNKEEKKEKSSYGDRAREIMDELTQSKNKQ